MLITEKKLRSIIRSVIKESSELDSRILERNIEKIKTVISKWLFDEVVDGKELREYAQYDLMKKIVPLYSERTFKDGTPIDLSDDIDFFCEKIMNVLYDYHKKEEGGYENDYEYLDTYDISIQDIESVTNKIFRVIEETVYVEIGETPNLEVADDELSIEQKILNALKNDLSEEEYKKIKPKIQVLIDYVKDDFEDNLARGFSFEESYEDAKNYLKSFYDF